MYRKTCACIENYIHEKFAYVTPKIPSYNLNGWKNSSYLGHSHAT